MPYLLYSKQTSTTGRHLREALGIPGGTGAPADQVDLLIRWGSSVGVPRRPQQLINSKAAVELATNKYQLLQHLRRRLVPVPPLWPVLEPNPQLPVLGRKDHHSKGSDIVLCLQRGDLERARQAGCSHFTGLIPKAREFRVHVFRNQVIKTSEKVLTDPTRYSPWLWNYETGFTFRNLRPLEDTTREQMEFIAQMAVLAVGLDFGAVDLCISDDNRIYVFEINTGPSLAENTLGVYAQKLADILGVTVNREVIEALNNLRGDDDGDDEAGDREVRAAD
jgi:hypothetical protein